MNPIRLKAITAITSLLFSSAALGAGYFVVMQKEKIKSNEAQIEWLTKENKSLWSDFNSVSDRQKLMLAENRNLHEEVKEFEAKKNQILEQVRTSVAGFESFRTTATNEIARLKAETGQLSTQKTDLEKKLHDLQNASSQEKEELTANVKALEEKIGRLRDAEMEMVKNLEKKDNSSVIKETGKLHYNLGNYYFRNQDYRAAAREYQKAIFYNPEDASANYNLALICDEFLDDNQTAAFRYKRYLELVPNAPDRKKIQEKILDLQIRDEVVDSGIRKEPREMFGDDGGKLSGVGLIGDRR